MLLFVLISAVVPLAIVGALLLTAIALGQKGEPDPTGRRPYLVYLLTISFVTLVVIVSAGAMVVQSLAQLGLDATGTAARGLEGLDPGSDLRFLDGPENADKVVTGQAIQAALVTGAALLLLVFHNRRLDEERRAGALESGPGARTYSTYLYILCFTTALVGVIAAAIAAYALVRTVAPGSVSLAPDDLERDAALVTLLASGAVAGTTGYLFQTHWNKVTELRAKLGGGPPATEPPAGQ